MWAKEEALSSEDDRDDIKKKHSKYSDRKLISDGGYEKLTDPRLKPSTKMKEDFLSLMSKKSETAPKVLLKKNGSVRNKKLAK